MDNIKGLPWIGADDFARRFSRRASSLMWLLGAGASAAAGIPTADDMIWDFKQQLYVSQRHVSLQSVADLSNPVIRDRLQAHIDSLGTLPPVTSPDEYAALFEAAYPAETDRRAYIDAKLSGAKPSFGHLALATLMRATLVRLVWTTNFDTLVADACAKVYDGTGYLTSVDLDRPELATQRMQDERWPVEIKIHGDFRSRRLKNTTDELRYQDSRLRQTLLDSCRRFGLVVVGYSGRDDSVMGTIEEALRQRDSFPSGLFWLHRGDPPPPQRLSRLALKAKELSVEVALVQIESFDEVLRDLVRLLHDIDRSALDSFATERSRVSGAPPPAGLRGWPVVRLNALPVLRTPSVCRRVVCTIGGYAEVREAVQAAGVDLLVARTRDGVLAYGKDVDVRAAFERFDIVAFDLHSIDAHRLRFESGERGLLRVALARALARRRGLEVFRRRGMDQFAPLDTQGAVWEPLRFGLLSERCVLCKRLVDLVLVVVVVGKSNMQLAPGQGAGREVLQHLVVRHASLSCRYNVHDTHPRSRDARTTAHHLGVRRDVRVRERRQRGHGVRDYSFYLALNPTAARGLGVAYA